MNARDVIKLGIDSGDMICMGYLSDLTDADLLKRPCPTANHTNWQVGHLIAAEHSMMEQVAPGSMPPLPEGFAARYAKEAASVDDPKKFCTKDELLAEYKKQRAGTLAVLAKVTDDELDKPTGVQYAPTVGAMLALQGSHWLMHAGQWVIVRRQLGRPPMF
jgi:hypothetical protein